MHVLRSFVCFTGKKQFVKCEYLALLQLVNEGEDCESTSEVEVMNRGEVKENITG